MSKEIMKIKVFCQTFFQKRLRGSKEQLTLAAGGMLQPFARGEFQHSP